MTDVVNAMSVDVEDYFQVSAFDDVVSRARLGSASRAAWSPTPTVCSKRSPERGVTGTFFFLGWVAERFPALVRKVSAAGHEIASHGYHHQLVYR